MKRVFTLIFFIFCLLRVSAAICQTDTIKKVAGNTDSLKTAPVNGSAYVLSASGNTFSLKAASVHHNTYSLKATPAENNVDSLKLNASIQSFNDFKAGTYGIKGDSIAIAIAKEAMGALEPVAVDNLPPITSLIQLDSLRATVLEAQARQDRLRKLILQSEQVKIAEVLKINNLDSLKLELKITTSDTIKALIYTRIALKYLNYDTIANKDKKYFYQNQAINYTLQAIREYATYNDSLALRSCFDNLAKVYSAQKKYTQAKWFILQSNTLSRAKNDTPNIISSLLTLVSIKSEIKDYTLAMGDLNEALQLSITNHTPKTELNVLKNYAQLYNQLQDYPKEAMVLKKRDSLLDSIRKSDEAALVKAAAQKKRTEMLQNKKKLYTANPRKSSKNNSQTKIASL